MTPRSLVLTGVAIVVLAGSMALALVVHADRESRADPPPAPASAVTPVDVLVRPSNTLDAAQVRRLTYVVGTPRKGRLPAIVTAAEPATGTGFPGAPARDEPVLARAGVRVIARESERTARRLRA